MPGWDHHDRWQKPQRHGYASLWSVLTLKVWNNIMAVWNRVVDLWSGPR